MLWNDTFPRHGRRLAAVVIGVALVIASALTGLAQAATFDGGGRVGGANEFTFASGPYAVTRESGKTWSFATGTDGKGYFTVYEGAWGDWQTFEDPPAEFGWQPTAADYNGSLYVVYPGRDGKYYLNSHDGTSFTGWQDIAGDYRFGDTPYANVADNWLWVYGVDGAGYLQYTYYNGSAWTPWAPVDADYAAEPYESYAVEWGGYNNVFWTGTDGLVYWNRYDGTGWTGTKALPGDYEFGSAPAATGYAPEQKLYAYGIGKAGAPYYIVFTEGEGWTGWAPAGGTLPVEAAWQPSVEVYGGAQHLVVTGTDYHAYYLSYNGAWSEWVDLGENYAYDPYTYTYGEGFYLTYTGETGAVYYKEYVTGSGGY